MKKLINFKEAHLLLNKRFLICISKLRNLKQNNNKKSNNIRKKEEKVDQTLKMCLKNKKDYKNNYLSIE